jgi:hypothetical protein
LVIPKDYWEVLLIHIVLRMVFKLEPRLMAVKITLEHFNFLVLVAEHIFVVIGEDSLFMVASQVLKEIDHAGAVRIRAKAVRNY